MPVYMEVKLMVTSSTSIINHQVNIVQSASGRRTLDTGHWTLDRQIFAIKVKEHAQNSHLFYAVYNNRNKDVQ